MSFYITVCPCNYYPNQITEVFLAPQKVPLQPFSPNYYDFFCHKLILPVFELHVNGICHSMFSLVSHFFDWYISYICYPSSHLLGLSLSVPSL